MCRMYPSWFLFEVVAAASNMLVHVSRKLAYRLLLSSLCLWQHTKLTAELDQVKQQLADAKKQLAELDQVKKQLGEVSKSRDEAVQQVSSLKEEKQQHVKALKEKEKQLKVGSG